ncbi:helix-turn-helix transcriptional regulator [Anaerolineales bacterium HSG6]|nr:helix-turn-helix transcriptional regulator [Anaerolineales bacterium HSG6]MDM8530673.1 helix-turn-helix transcriptional regulator [Anaerolineales bacterium HSG25]
MEKFGEKLRTLRQQHGFSQSQLSDTLGVTRTHVSRMERGEKMPNVLMLLKISNIFGVSADLLIRDEMDLD